MLKKIAVITKVDIFSNELLMELSEKNLNIGEIVVLSPENEDEGKEISYGYTNRIIVKNLQTYDFKSVDLAIFMNTAEISKVYTKKAVDAGCVIIDNTSCFREDKNIPLISYEINKEDIKKYKDKKIISLPSASSLQLSAILKPLSDLSNIKRVVVSTYQGVSGLGQGAMDELFAQTKKIYQNEFENPINFKKQIPFNLFPQVGDFCENNNYEEENFIINETNKILDASIDISATCVRVPVFACYSQSINIEFESEVEVEDAEEVLSETNDILILDKPNEYIFAVPRECSAQNEIYVSRLRNGSSKKILNLWSVMDNVKKGKVVNLINSLEYLLNL